LYCRSLRQGNIIIDVAFNALNSGNMP